MRKSLMERFISKVKKTETCWLWIASKNPAGYGQFGVWKNGKRSILKAHRVSYELFKGEIPSGLLIRHMCNNPICVNPEHLELGTYQQNVDDQFYNPNNTRRKHLLPTISETRKERQPQKITE